MSTEEDVDMDYLISLVQDRPVLWDKTSEMFKNKNLKTNAWAEICKCLFEEYDTFDNNKKNKIANDMIQKWRSVKDNFFKYVKKIKENSASETGAKKIKKYHYYNQLLFLMKVAQNKIDNSIKPSKTVKTESEDSMSTCETLAVSAPTPSRYVTPNRKRKMDDFENDPLKALRDPENRHLSFFKGILPSILDFDEYQTLLFQSRILQIIKDMRFGHTSE